MAELLFTDILTRLRPGYKKGGVSFKDQGFEPLPITERNKIKKKFPKKKLNFKEYRFGMPKSDSDYETARYVGKRYVQRKERTIRESKDPIKVEQKKATAADYYKKEKINILERARKKYETNPLYREKIAVLNKKNQLNFYKKSGFFPPGTTPQENVWMDLYRSSKSGDGRYVLEQKYIDKIPKNKDGIKAWSKDGYHKKIKFLDTKTGERISFGGMKSYLNKKFGKGTYERALDGYRLKNDLKNVRVKVRGKEQNFGTVLRDAARARGQKGVLSAFEVHHPYGVKNNWWNNQVSLRDANRNLIRINNQLEREYKTAINQIQKKSVLKKFGKQVDKLPGGISLFFEGQQVGRRTPTPTTLLTEGAKFYKDPALRRAIGKVLKGAGKVIKPLGIVTGALAVNTALKAGERNPFDLAGAYVTADPKVATDARRMRQEPEFRKQQIAGLPQIQPEGFEMMEEEDFTSYFNGGIVAVKGVK